MATLCAFVCVVLVWCLLMLVWCLFGAYCCALCLFACCLVVCFESEIWVDFGCIIRDIVDFAYRYSGFDCLLIVGLAP